MIKIYPKVDEAFAGIGLLKPYIKEGIEIQLLKPVENEQLESVLTRLRLFECPSIKEVTLHMNMVDCSLTPYLHNKYKFTRLVSTLTCIGYLQKKLGIKINLLVHLIETYDALERADVLKDMEVLCSYLEEVNVLLLVENDICIWGVSDMHDHMMEFVRRINHPNVRGCLDICHIYCIANMTHMEYAKIPGYIGEGASDFIHQIHFADTWNNDGYKDMSTHARYHNEMTIERDLKLLDTLGISDKNIVTEVTEEGKDYTRRDGQIRELELLKKLRG